MYGDICVIVGAFWVSIANSYCVGIENVESGNLEHIDIVIVNSPDYDLEDVISRTIAAEII